MNSERLNETLDLIERELRLRPSPWEFEIAYQARVAIDRIRFAIKHAEQFGKHSQEMREANLQLLDALDRLESAERNFQKRFRSAPTAAGRMPEVQSSNGKPHQSQGGGA